MRAKIHGTAMKVIYLYDGDDSLTWYHNLMNVADLYASRFCTSSMPSFTAMYADVSWYDSDQFEKTFSILVGDPAKALFNSVHDNIELDNDSWLCLTSSNFQIIVFYNVDTHDCVAFVG